jgi:hypothetical protein
MKNRVVAALLCGSLAALPVACAGGNPGPSPSPSPQSPTLDELADKATGSTEVQHGGRYWAVYLAAGPPQSGDVTAAEAFLESLRIASVSGPADCDRGATGALDVSKRDVAVAVYFDTERDARAFADQLVPPPVAVVKVRTFCAD